MLSKKTFQVYNASAGSGKTYTLVKEYLKIILSTSNRFKFQEILATTFTNKAAAEMKERVLESLIAFSEMPKTPKNSLFLDVQKELNLDTNTLKNRSEKVLKSILNNYAAFGITTIDSFTHKLIKSFAFDLGLSMNFEVEMDPTSLLNEAVDILIAKIGIEPKITKTLINYAKQKANEDKSWDVSLDLQEIAKLLTKETDILQIKRLEDKKTNDFVSLDKILQKRIQETVQKFKIIGEKGLAIFNDSALNKSDFAGGGDIINHFIKLKNSNLEGLLFSGRLDGNIEKNHNQYSGKTSASAKIVIDSIRDELVGLYTESKVLYQKDYPNYILDVLVRKSLIPLSVLTIINTILDEIKTDNNIRLNVEFNQIIHKHLTEQPAAFIYEKIGERYRHYFIDEMQDTSILQWKNSIPLLKNALESENEKGELGTLMLDGDAKQSIYRWRGSDPEQFIALTNDYNPFFVQKHTETLQTNYRSYSEIIKFNNAFFTYISKYLQNSDYANLYEIGNKQAENSNKGGFVQLSFLENVKTTAEKDEAFSKKILEIIQNLDGKFAKNEICILVREKKQGVAIANYLNEKGVSVISSETLLIENSDKVRFVIDILKFITEPNDTDVKFSILSFLHNHSNSTLENHEFYSKYIALEPAAFFTELNKLGYLFDFENFIALPFYESIETSIRSFKLIQKSDAYLQFFLDFVLEFSHKKNTGITGFLEFWEEKKEKLSIVVPQGKDAVQIMTIHKSKGLEFPVVIYAYDLNIYKVHQGTKIWYDKLNPSVYNDFTTTLVAYNKTLNETGLYGKTLFQEKEAAMELDNFNLLYVALTRAKEQLYVLSENTKIPKDRLKNYSHFFIDYLTKTGDWNVHKLEYSYGNPERISKKEKASIISETQAAFFSSPWQEHNITIVANSVLNTDFEDARKYGNTIHEILASIYTKSDINKVITSFVNSGKIPLEKEVEITKTIQKVVENKNLATYFTDLYTIYNEREIINESHEILIPDRIAIKDNKATIIDYKTGKPEPNHKFQVSNYAAILEKMDFKIVEKLLVYIDDGISVVRVA